MVNSRYSWWYLLYYPHNSNPEALSRAVQSISPPYIQYNTLWQCIPATHPFFHPLIKQIVIKMWWWMLPVMVSESDLKWVQERQKTKSQGLIWTVYTSANHSADQIWKKVQLKPNLEETKIYSQYANMIISQSTFSIKVVSSSKALWALLTHQRAACQDLPLGRYTSQGYFKFRLLLLQIVNE